MIRGLLKNGLCGSASNVSQSRTVARIDVWSYGTCCPGRGAKYRSRSYVRGHQNGRYAHAKPDEIKGCRRESAAEIQGAASRGRQDMSHNSRHARPEGYHQQDVVVVRTGPHGLVYVRQKLLSASKCYAADDNPPENRS